MVRRGILTALVATIGCSFPEQPIPEGVKEIVVHAALDPSQRYQTVSLSMTHGEFSLPDGAVVTITTPDGTVLTAREKSPLEGQFPVSTADYQVDFAAAGMSVVPGASYQLRILTSRGDTITGQTTIPSMAPAAASATRPFDRNIDTLRYHWPRVPGARAYEVQVWLKRGYPEYFTTQMTYKAFVDTTLTLAGTARGFDDNAVFDANTTAYVNVYAVDDNYYDYYRVPGDPYMGALPSRLTGGLGFFGAVVPVAQLVLAVQERNDYSAR